MPKKPFIDYTSRSFDSIKQDLIEHAKRYYPESYNDFNQSSFGSMIFDSVAYVGDMLSFFLDLQMNESFLETAIDFNNVRKLASQMGYNFYGRPSAYGVAAFYILVPANSLGTGPNSRFIPVLKSKTRISSAQGATFMLTEDVNFNEPEVEVVAARFNQTTGKPTHYAMKYYGQVKSGNEFFTTVDVGDFVKFLNVRVTNASVQEIISVFDSEGHEYYQVDHLSQEVVYLEKSNPNVANDGVRSILKPYIASRRFMVQQNENGTFLQFGHGSETEIDTNGLADPSQVVLQMSGKNYVTDTAFDPTKFLGTDKFGIVPTNTTLSITYAANDSNVVNVPINGLSTITSPDMEFPNDLTSPNTSEQVSVIISTEVTNEERITTDSSLPTVDEIKYRTMAVFSAQNRTVTRNDYEAYVYQMPVKFGKICRASVVNDPSGMNKRLAMYVISKDENDLFKATHDTVKSNLKVWLNKNKMVSDNIDIFDARIINVGFDFTYAVEPGKSKTTVQADVNTAVRAYFAEKLYIGEPIYITKIYQIINRVEGVVDTIKVKPVMKQTGNYSNLALNVEDIMSPDGTFLKCPKNCVFEIKYPGSDLRGTVL